MARARPMLWAAMLPLGFGAGVAPAGAESLESALVQAYRNNPSLNSQRASVRATDENVPQALSGYRPKVTLNATGGEQTLSSTTRSTVPGGPPTTLAGSNAPFSASAVITQTLFNGFQTANKTRQAESQVLAARATLRNTEQSVLLKQLRQTRDRFNVGEVTRTDVAQSESSLAQGRSSVLQAEANYKASLATYRQVIGVDPGALVPASPVDRFTPNTLAGAVAVGTATHPSVTLAQYNVDVALLAVKVAEGALYPTLSVTGNVTK